jgi:GxxExxY protein
MPLPEPSARVDEVAYRVIGAAIEVHRQLGPGLDVSAYHNALLHELQLQGMAVKARVPIAVEYKGHVVGELLLDLVVEGELIVELKAVERLEELHRAALIAHLQAARLELGLLINFNVALLKDGLRRVVRCKPN